MAVLIDGKALAAKVKEEVRAEAQQLTACPGLAVIIVGEDPASKTYVKNKGLACEACGFSSQTYFCYKFKQVTEMTPMQYRSEMLSRPKD